jgi:hypothetical protein
MVYERKALITRICDLATCSEVFETAYDRQRFHSDACRKEFIKLVQMGECPHCGRRLVGAEKES